MTGSLGEAMQHLPRSCPTCLKTGMNEAAEAAAECLVRAHPVELMQGTVVVSPVGKPAVLKPTGARCDHCHLPMPPLN